MSVQSEINRINTAVNSQTTLLDQALALIEGKAAGGGGAAPATCTVSITSNTTDGLGKSVATCIVNGAITAVYHEGGAYAVTYENVVCGSAFAITIVGTPTVSGVERVESIAGAFYYRITAGAGETATISISSGVGKV